MIAIAGRAKDHVGTLLDISKGDTVLDYRASDNAVVKGIRAAPESQKLEHAYDTTTEHNSSAIICEVLDRETGKITLVLPPTK